MSSNANAASPGRHDLPLPKPIAGAQPLIKKFLQVDRLTALYDEARSSAREQPVWEHLLDTLDVAYSVDARELDSIPREGPLVAVANHPFGMIEGTILAALLPRIRPDVRIMTNFLLSALVDRDLADQDRSVFLWVDPFGTRDSLHANRKPLREAMEWLRDGGMLVVFPAGEVAHLELGRRTIVDSDWSLTVSRLIRRTGAGALPIYFHGTNSLPFQMLGLVHPKLRTIRLPHEFLNKRGKEIKVRIGTAVPHGRLIRFSDEEMRDYLYRRTYLLANREIEGSHPAPVHLPFAPRSHKLQPLTGAADPKAVEHEIEQLGADRRLADYEEFHVYAAAAGEIPATLQELGRLREVSFRAVGEGSGKPADLDEFDRYYDHLFVWNTEKKEIVGAYRLGRADEIIERRGIRGLYTSTLFDYSRGFFHHLGPAIELGRSFVRTEYQKSFAPLMLLWKGIGAYVAATPRYHVLFGPVSISNDYHAVSKQFMVRFLKSRCHSADLAGLVHAHKAFKVRPPKDWELEVTEGFVEDIEDLSHLIAEIERDHKGVPILIRQYLKLGGRLLEFNVDPKFSSALDGLVVVDLLETDPKILRRYMGGSVAGRFLAFHQAAKGA